MTGGALAGIHVLDLAGPSGAMAGRMLADLGADVIGVEPPGGSELRRRGPFAGGVPHPERSIPFLVACANKRGITLSPWTTEGGDLFRRLVAASDVVIDTCAPRSLDAHDLGYEALSGEHPALVWASITPFGQWGPHADFKATELGAQAMGGALYLTGEPGERPVLAGGHIAETMSGYMAATAIMFALYHRDTCGQGQYIDLSTQEAIVSQMESFTTKIFYTGAIYARDGRLYPRTYPAGLFPCRDGWVSLVAGPLHQWHGLCDWIDDDRLRETKFEELDVRLQERGYLDEIICDWTAGFTKADLFHEGQRRRIPVGISLTPAEVPRDPHLQARGYAQPIDHPVCGTIEMPGRPYLLEKTPWELRRAAPTLGQHNVEVYGDLGIGPRELSALRERGVV